MARRKPGGGAMKPDAGQCRRTVLTAAWLLLWASRIASATGLPAQPTSVIVFGDSLSDAGNAYLGSLHHRAPSPPYYQGRFSDGPVWVEMVAAHFGLKAEAALRGGTNFAIGGAKVAVGADSLPHQAELYLLLSAFSRPDPGALYVIFGGGNDIRRALKRTDPAPALAQAALGIRRMIETLAVHGAVNFLVPNVPNRGRTPAARARGTAAAEQRLTRAFDAALDAALRDIPLRHRINVVRVDFWSAVERAFAAPKDSGFSDVAEPCLVASPSGYRQCPDPAGHAFWDDVHPTSRGHRLLAATALAAYDAASALASADPATLAREPQRGPDAPATALEQEVLELVRGGGN